MGYFKIVDGDYILAVGTGSIHNISEDEYNEIMNAIQNRPNDGREYLLRTDLTWEEVTEENG